MINAIYGKKICMTQIFDDNQDRQRPPGPTRVNP